MKNVRNFLLFLILSIFIIFSQMRLLETHLKYGFGDVDSGHLSTYIMQKPQSLKKFINNFTNVKDVGGIYTHQIYYIGLQYDFFGLDFWKYQYTTHVFKILAILICFFLFKIISANNLIAAISTIIFGFNYAAVGTMYTVVTSSDYSAIFSMGIFSIIYWKALQKRKLVLYFLALLSLLLTLFLSTERMYPILALILAIEAFRFINNYETFPSIFKRLAILFSPVLLIFFIKPAVFLNFLFGQGGEIPVSLSEGNWNIFLTPFIALGSILSPHSYSSIMGSIDFHNPFSYFRSFLIIIFLTIIISIFISKRPSIFILRMLIINLFFILFFYIIGNHFTTHIIVPISMNQAIIGGFLISIALTSFADWVKFKKRILIGIFAGLMLSFLYILVTWMAAHVSEVFAGTHRYLTVPAIGVSFFLGSIIVSVFQKLYIFSKRAKFLMAFSFLPFLILIPYFNINNKEIQDFFNYQISQGFGANDKNFMRSQLINQLQNLSAEKPSLFYFDSLEDSINDYYYTNTIYAGFESWMLWNPKINFKKEVASEDFRNQPQLLSTLVREVNGEKLIYYNHKYFHPADFYAFRLKDKKVINIKSEILRQIGLE